MPRPPNMSDDEILRVIKDRRDDLLSCPVNAIKKLTRASTDRVRALLTRADEKLAPDPAPRPAAENTLAEALPAEARRRVEAHELEWARQAARLRATERAAADEQVWLARTEAAEALDRAAVIEADARSQVAALAGILADTRAQLREVSKSLRAEKKQCRVASRENLELQAEVTRLLNDLESRRASGILDGSAPGVDTSPYAHDEKRTSDPSADAPAIPANVQCAEADDRGPIASPYRQQARPAQSARNVP